MNIKSVLEYVATIQCQLALMAISSVVIIFLFQGPLHTFSPVNRKSFVIPVQESIVSTWDKKPARVKTGFMFYEFLKFDPLKNEFLMTGMLWFEFDPTKISAEIIDQFTFSKGEIVEKSKPIIKKKSDNKLYVQYYVRVQFMSLLDYKRFPLDDHLMSLNLIHNSIEAYDVLYEIDQKDFVIPSYVFLSGWSIIDHEARAGYNELKISPDRDPSLQPKIVFSLSVKKNDVRQLSLMLLALFALFYFALFTLTLKDFSLKISSIFAIITAFVGLTFVIQFTGPTVSYFMMIDYFNLFLLIAITIVFLVDLLDLSFKKDASGTSSYECIKGLTVLMLYSLLLILVYTVLYII